MRRTPAFAAIAGAAVIGMLAASLTGCSSSGNTNGQGDAGGPTPTTVPQLGAKLLAGARSVTSAHMDLSFDLGGVSLHGSGVERLSNGNLVALDLTESSPTGGSFRVIRAGGKTYLKLPPAENPNGKPYILVTPQSSNPVVKQLAGSLGTLSGGSIASFQTFVRAAKSIKVDGRETVNGAGATHYSVTVDISKLPSTSGLDKQALAASGVKTVPVEMWVDDQGRPVKVTEQLAVQGQSISVSAVISHFNEPVTITAPPPDQVSTN